MGCVTITIPVAERLIVTGVTVSDKSGVHYSLTNPVPLGVEVVLFVYTNQAADGKIEVRDNGGIINTLYATKGVGFSGWYYTFSTPGEHKICAEVV